MLKLDAFNDNDCDELIEKVSRKINPIFKNEEYTLGQNRAIYRYLFSRRPKKLPPSMKNRLINLYDPMADRSSRFPDGLRWCLNVYVGCEHNCGYCYVNAYSQDSVGISIHPKAGFEKKLIRDIDALETFGVPSVPIHLSNSTDPLQETLEKHNHHTLLSLQAILRHRKQFTAVTMLTKNPSLLCEDLYLSIITHPEMRPFRVQITCPYWNDDARRFFEPNAPSVHSRLEALRFLAANGIDVDLRIDPLFPSSRISKEIRLHEALPAYSLPEAQSHEDIVSLVGFAKKFRVKSIIVNTLRIPVSNRAQRCKSWFDSVYQDANKNKKKIVKGWSWRLPDEYQKSLISTVEDICTQEEMTIKHCIHDVLTRH